MSVNTDALRRPAVPAASGHKSPVTFTLYARCGEYGQQH